MTMLAAANAQEVTRDVGNMADDELAVALAQVVQQAKGNIVEGRVMRIEQQDADE